MATEDYYSQQIIALVVDDSEIVRRAIIHHLEQRGCLVFSARDGEEAVHLAEKGFLDLILMDLYMPLVDGWEASKRIRQTEKEKRRRPAYIVAMSGAPDRTRCLAAGMNDAIAKPVTPELLESIIRDAQALQCQETADAGFP